MYIISMHGLQGSGLRIHKDSQCKVVSEVGFNEIQSVKLWRRNHVDCVKYGCLRTLADSSDRRIWTKSHRVKLFIRKVSCSEWVYIPIANGYYRTIIMSFLEYRDDNLHYTSGLESISLAG